MEEREKELRALWIKRETTNVKNWWSIIFLPSLPNLRFFLPRLGPAEELLLELLSLLFQRINMFRKRFSVSKVNRTASFKGTTRAHARAFTKRGSSLIAPLRLSIDSRDRKMFSAFLRDLVLSSIRASQMAIVFVYFDSSFRFESSYRWPLLDDLRSENRLWG